MRETESYRMEDMLGYIPSKDYREYLEKENIELTEWDKAALIYNHRTASHDEKVCGLLNLQAKTKQPLLKKQLLQRIDRDESFYERFQEGGENICYILKTIAGDKYVGEEYYTSYEMAHAEGLILESAFAITKESGKAMGIFGTVEYDETGHKKKINLYSIDGNDPFDEHAKERFENKYIDAPLMFRRGDMVHIIGTEKYGIVDWPVDDKDENDSREKLRQLGNVDYSDFQVPVNLIYDKEKFLSIFSHAHIAPTDLEYARLEDTDVRKGMLEYMVKTLYGSSWFHGSGRDASRINTVLTDLEIVWRQFPDMRLGQLLISICGRRDLFSIEDEELLDRLQQNKFPIVF